MASGSGGRNALEVGQGADVGPLVLLRVPQVHDEGAGTRAGQRAWLVIGAGRRRLFERRHALDFQPRLGAQIEQRSDALIRVVEDLLVIGHDDGAARVARREVEPRLGEQLRHPRAQVRYLLAVPRQDSLHLGLNAVDFAQAQRMDRIGRHVGGGVVAQALVVISVAIRQLPDPVVVAGHALQVLFISNEPLIGRIDGVLDLTLEIAGELSPVLGRERLDRVSLGGEVGIKGVLARRLADEALHLRQHLADHEAWRNDLLRLAHLEAFDRLVDRHSELPHA